MVNANNPLDDKDEKEIREKMEDIYREIYEDFLNDVFCDKGKATREDFIDMLRGPYKKYLNPREIRIMASKKKEKKEKEVNFKGSSRHNTEEKASKMNQKIVL